MDGPDFGEVTTGFGAFVMVVGLVFVVIAGIIVFAVVKGVKQWSRNNASPITTLAATVVAKRSEMRLTSGSVGDTAPHSTSSRTWYYATFEVPGGTRVELSMSGSDYGQLAEGDRGMLTHQGTRYKGFARTPQDR
jgi:hypothetical protein